MARSMLSHNLDAINPDGTVTPVPGEIQRSDDPGHAAMMAELAQEPDMMDLVREELAGTNTTDTAAPSTPPPADGVTGPNAARDWLSATEKRDPGGPAAPWRHAGSVQLQRMGLEALRRIGAAEGALHEKYLSERRTFWALNDGRAFLMPDGTVQFARKGGQTAAQGGSGSEGTPRTTGAQKAPREALAGRVGGLRDQVNALRDSLTGHRIAPAVEDALSTVVRCLNDAEMASADLPDGWGVKPRESAPAPATLVPGMTVEIPEKLRQGPVSEGMIEADDAASPLTVKSVINDKVAVCVTASGEKVRLFVRILRPVTA